MKSNGKLILASASPRRHELLARAQVGFEVIVSGVEESRRPGEPARDYAMRMAREKSLAVSELTPDRHVLAADTVVECAGQVLEKPADAGDAARMLAALSGVTHVVITGFALAYGGRIIENQAVTSRVTFRALTPAEIAAYVATGEPFDKAGGYGIQGIGGGFISHVDGSRDNVMGLPTDEVVAVLARNEAV